MISIVIPEYVVAHWWQHLLHNQTALRLKGRLLFEPSVAVTSVPWVLGAERGATDGRDEPAGHLRPQRGHARRVDRRSASRRTFGLSRRRQLTGLVLAVLLLPLLTLLLDALDDELALDGQVLVYLLAVVVDRDRRRRSWSRSARGRGGDC